MQEFVQQIKDTVDECISDIHTALPAKIVSVDSATGLATVLPTMKKVLANGSTMSYPQISGVPVVLPQGSGQLVSIAFPVKAGDSCLLIISEQSLEYWLYGRETDTTLLFDITNAICIPGLFQAPPDSFLDACDSDSVIVDAGETKLVVNTAGIGITGSLTVNGDLTVIGEASMESGVSVGGVLDVTGAASANGGASIKGNLSVTGGISAGGNASIDGNIEVGGSGKFGGSVSATNI